MRKAVIFTGQFINHTPRVLIKIPLPYHLTSDVWIFLIIDNKLDLELELRENVPLIKDAAFQASHMFVINTELYFLHCYRHPTLNIYLGQDEYVCS